MTSTVIKKFNIVLLDECDLNFSDISRGVVEMKKSISVSSKTVTVLIKIDSGFVVADFNPRVLEFQSANRTTIEIGYYKPFALQQTLYTAGLL